MKKLLQINVVYKEGSTGKIVYDIHSSLKEEGWDSHVIYGRGKKPQEEKTYKSQTYLGFLFNGSKARITGMPYRGSFLSTKRIIKYIEETKPDLIHLQCINGHFVNIYKLLDYIKKKEIKVLLTLHAEFMHTGSCPHSFDCMKWKSACGKCPYLWEATKSYFFDFTHKNWKMMKRGFEGLNIDIVAPSKWIQNRASLSPITESANFNLINNGINIDVFKPSDFQSLKDKHNIGDEKVLLHVTADFKDPIKGGKYFIDLCRKLEDEPIKIILIGKNADREKLGDNVIYLDHISSPHELAKYYSLADIFVMASIRETYPTVCLESVSCGTPVVAFDTGGVKEAIPHGFGMTFDLYDIASMKEWIVSNLDYKKGISKEALEKARTHNDKKRMAREYIDLYKRILESN